MSEKPDINELLSCYIDGELNERQATEVKRMVLHDRKIAEKVAQMQRQRKLLAALPVEAAPADTADSVRAVLERKTLLIAASSGRQHISGSLHLLGRKFVAAAAMLALLGGLGVLVCKVIVPGKVAKPGGFAVSFEKRQGDKSLVAEGGRVVPAPVPIELVLKTASPGGLNSVIARAIDSCGLWGCVMVDRQLSQTGYSIACGKEGIARIMGELAGVWDRVDAKSLSVMAPGEEVVTVSAVTVEQIVAVIEAPDLPSRVAWARQFAQINSEERFMVATSETPNADSTAIKIPKPSLTSPDFDRAATAEVGASGDDVSLTIIVIGAE